MQISIGSISDGWAGRYAIGYRKDGLFYYVSRYINNGEAKTKACFASVADARAFIKRNSKALSKSIPSGKVFICCSFYNSQPIEH